MSFLILTMLACLGYIHYGACVVWWTCARFSLKRFGRARVGTSGSGSESGSRTPSA